MSTPAPPAFRPEPPETPARTPVTGTKPRRRTAALSLVLGGLLATAAVNPASAAQPSPDQLLQTTAVEAHRGSSAASDIPDVAIAPPGEGIITRREDTPVAPGVSYTSFDRLDARGWLRGDILVADLDAGGVTVDYLNPGTVSGREVLSQQVARKGAIAGVNGDFFDINDTGAPLGIGIERDADGGAGRFVNGPAAGHNETAVIDKNGLGRIAQVFLEGTATDDDASKVDLTNLNSPSVNSGGIGLYTPQWGEAARTRTVDGLPTVREVILRDGVVVSSATTPATTPLAANELALVGREAGATALTAFEPGDKVEVKYGPRADAADVAVGLSGNIQLARDGQILNVDDTALHPRTAIGFSADGRRMVLLTVDGRMVDSRGLTEKELARLMLDLGSDDVLNLDGGGSSTMLKRSPGEATPEVVNKPSDGSERLTPNGLGLLPVKGSGRLKGFRIEATGTAAELADTDITRSSRVFTGLSRVLTARGHDETYAPAPGTPYWSVGSNANVTGQGIVTGRRAGDVIVTAANGTARGRFPMTVLGTPIRLAPSSKQVSLPDATAKGFFTVSGFDADGFSTWVEPRDVKLTFDPALVKVVAWGNGFDVSAVGADAVSTVVTAKVGDLTTQLSVTAGLSSEVVDEVDDTTRWQANAVPVGAATASRSAAEGHDGGQAIALDYSLTGSTATRAAYLSQTPQQTLPGQPQKLGAWVYGDGKGAWLRANAYDAAGGAAQTLNLAAAVDWTGWKYVEADIPPGLTMPLRFWRIYVVETVPTRQYSGRIVIDDLTVRGAPPVTVTPSAKVVDPMVVTDGTATGGGRWKFAVMSDAQFTADDPESDFVKQARRTIREALAQNPDFLVINGDFVDRGFSNDVALAKKIIDEEVAGKVPVHYVPGNHESYGPGDLSEWKKVFGEPTSTFDHKGTRFVLRDSSLGSLRAGGFDQILDLRKQLDDAARNPEIHNVVMMAHHPIDDPSPTQNSQLGDRKEADLLVRWLADFRASTGKGAAYMAAHAGTFAATRIDGVLLPLTGNSGKGPAAAPDAGGFTGWALVGIDPSAREAAAGERHWSAPERSWFQLELRPHVDSLELAAPTSLRSGTSAPAAATVVQENRRVPVSFPVSADWWGSSLLHIGPARTAPFWAVAAYDPATGQLTGIRPGTVQVGVTVNGVSKSATVKVDW
ncbi:calcineurin-like phosphoesterase family protein [Kribbella orskensis]|uniref:Calcineurin-like phosphoesterase family protein n=1 Tax=Kribbella orskensis TaxID=2512216 RepID=A0ABY2BQ60_9ACTN|nr:MULTISPECIES: phosphodiester glycosidase family protein [Kribbella]TCN39741.1 calcineurin-like phosphoesterase family protein [Kribbella sp. VKM Ac-2500]TCO27476.1 calcineurin-like phosphoesterase family protein [Kribbella orskensis]